MKTIKVRGLFAGRLCLVCVPLLAGSLMVAQQPAPPSKLPHNSFHPDQLAPCRAVALYPDALLSQVLVAAPIRWRFVRGGAVAAAKSQSTGPNWWMRRASRIGTPASKPWWPFRTWW